jgi:integrase
MLSHPAILTGLEPATSAVTGRRANQLRYRTLLLSARTFCDPNGIRTRAAAVKGRCPRPLNDGAEKRDAFGISAQDYLPSWAFSNLSVTLEA